MSEHVAAIKAALDEHWNFDNDDGEWRCSGCKAPLEGVDLDADLQAHLADVLAALIPDGDERVEWSLMRGGQLVITPRHSSDGRWNENLTLAEARDMWYPDCRVVRRTITTYAPRYTDWTVEG